MTVNAVPFELTECQKSGLFRLTMTHHNFIICGAAGTGKTTLLRQLLSAFPDKRIIYCAPTHAAKEVIQETLNVDAHTIHSILRISADTYEDQVVFDQTGIPDLSEVDILVLDEASMVDGQLFQIMVNTVPPSCRIFGLGDPYQLQPVKNDPGIISPIFFSDQFERIILKEIVRQGKDSPIIQVSTHVRKEGGIPYHFVKNEEEGVFKHNSLSDLMRTYWKYVKVPEDMLKYKIIAYTNKTVDKLNDIIRQRIYNTTEPFIRGEYLVMQQPVSRELRSKGMKITEPVFHNGETVQIVQDNQCNTSSIEKIIETFRLPEYDGLDPIHVEYYKIYLRNKKGDQTYPINVIVDESSRAELDTYLHYTAMHYKRMSRTGASKYKMRDMWSKFWDLKNKFTDVKGAAACTFHKSQGSTYDGVFILRSGLDEYCDEKIRRQLDYVGLTRARYFAHFL
ncbi:MAG: ATP-dependent DNA helicase [Bacilli bacterium]